jgi:ribonuclease P protein component
MELRPLIDRKVFEQGLSGRPVARSAHFSLHHVSPMKQYLSTDAIQPVDESVDNQERGCANTADLIFLGMVVPKRHAARAVTRNAVKRQIRQVAQDQAARLLPGTWIVRLKAPFAQRRIGPASSPALKALIRAEVLSLFRPTLIRGLEVRSTGPISA